MPSPPSSPSPSPPPLPSPPYLLKLRSSTSFLILTVSLAIFTDIFLYGIVVPVLPFALTTRVGVQPSSVQTWVSVLLAVYGAAILVVSPVVGAVADRLETRRGPMVAGLLALGGATVMLCVGKDVGVLIAGRVLQGISAGVVWVVGLALMVDTVGPEAIGRTMGYVGLAMSLAVLLAPMLGGIVFAASGYYQVFAMAFGLIVLDIVLRLAMVEKKVARRYLGDGRGEEGSGAEVEEVEGEVEGQVAGVEKVGREWKAGEDLEKSRAGETTSTDRDATATHGGEITDESRNDVAVPEAVPGPLKAFIHRLPPILMLLTSRRLLSALWASMMQAILLTALDSVLPLYVRDTFHWNSTGAGLIFLPLIVPTFVGPITGWASDKYGPRYISASGFLCGGPIIILLRLVDHDSLRQKVLVCALLALLGLCLTVALTPIMAEITYCVDAKSKRRAPGFFGKYGAYAQAYSLWNMAWAGGSMIGPLLGGLVNEASGWPTATLILGIASAVTTIPVVIWTGGSIFKQRRTEKEEAHATS